jgi:hypothetical protein
MKKNYVNVCVLFGLTLALAACPTGDGGGSGGPPSPQSAPIEHTLTSASDDLVIKITETNKQPDIRAAISPVKGNYYWVFKSGDLINKGTITGADGTIITFSGGFTLTLDGGSYTLSGSISNSRPGGVTISGPISFTGSTSNSIPKSIRITGITGMTPDVTIGEAGIHILTIPDFEHGPNHIAREVYHTVSINNGEVYADLYVSDGYDALAERWTGTGKYYIFLVFASATGWSDDGGGQNHFFAYAKDHQIVEYDIQDAVTIIPFSYFIPE